VGIDADQKFRSAVAAMGTRAGDRTLFAGTSTGGPALAAAEDILAALDAEVSGALTAAAVEAAVTAWFDAPGGYAALAYRGGPPMAPFAVAQGETVALAVTAADPAVRDTLKGLALGALLQRGALSAAPAERAALAMAAGTALMESQAARTDMAARIGTAEQGIAAVEGRNAAEASALGIARAGLLGADPFETATALADAQTRIEALYAVTARLSRLSLVDYL
jgi:flagellar hook-associated protein 3 FlgL